MNWRRDAVKDTRVLKGDRPRLPLVFGAVIIRHKLCLSDRETVAQIQENYGQSVLL